MLANDGIRVVNYRVVLVKLLLSGQFCKYRLLRHRCCSQRVHDRVRVHREGHNLPILEHLEVVFLHLVVRENKLLIGLLDLQHVYVFVLNVVQVYRLLLLGHVHNVQFFDVLSNVLQLFFSLLYGLWRSILFVVRLLNLLRLIGGRMRFYDF